MLSFASRHARALVKHLLLRCGGVRATLDDTHIITVPPVESRWFWSIAHKRNGARLLCCAVVARVPCGCDIEVVRPRHRSLLPLHNIREYRLLGGCTWKNFYTLWCAKEAVGKATGEGLRIMAQMRCVRATRRRLLITTRDHGAWYVHIAQQDSTMVAFAHIPCQNLQICYTWDCTRVISSVG